MLFRSFSSEFPCAPLAMMGFHMYPSRKMENRTQIPCGKKVAQRTCKKTDDAVFIIAKQLLKTAEFKPRQVRMIVFCTILQVRMIVFHMLLYHCSRFCFFDEFQARRRNSISIFWIAEIQATGNAGFEKIAGENM